jgi:MFS family permease
MKVKSMLGEMTDKTNRGKAFALWEVAFGLGTVFGPVLGGVLVNPVAQYGMESEFLKMYPYLLPCIVRYYSANCSSVFSLISCVLAVFFLDESEMVKKRRGVSTNVITPQSPDNNVTHTSSSNNDSIVSETPLVADEEQPLIDPSNPAHPQSALSTQVLLNILAYAVWCLVIVVYDEVYVLYVAEPHSHGGLQFNPFEIGIGISITGFIQLTAQLVIYPTLESRMTQLQIFRFAGALVHTPNSDRSLFIHAAVPQRYLFGAG